MPVAADYAGSEGIAEFLFQRYPFFRFLAAIFNVPVYLLLHYVMPYLVDFDVILAHQSEVDDKFIAFWSRKGVNIVAWTVNDPQSRQHFLNRGISVITD